MACSGVCKNYRQHIVAHLKAFLLKKSTKNFRKSEKALENAEIV
jgi:hypothetical protein